MTSSIEEIAAAISGHHFEDAFPHLADEVTWTMVGGATLVGREAVIEACQESASYLSGVTTRFRRSRSIAAGDTVVIDSEADYTEAGGDRTTVASCDIYDFTDGMLTAIISYNVELEQPES